MTFKRKQHILPETYLKHWIDPATKVENKTPMVWVISRDGKRRDPKPPAADRFWRDYFYDLFSTTGERRQDLENLLSKIEDGVSRIIDGFDQRISQGQPFSQTEAEVIDLFVACMFMRSEHMNQIISASASTKARIEKDHAKAEGKTVPDTSAYEHNAYAHAAYEGILLVSEKLAEMSHILEIAPPEKTYVTSDTPCVWSPSNGFVGLANPELEITLPLTPRHLLHISKTIPTSGAYDAPGYLVDQRNWEMIRNCRSYFVGKSSELDPSWFETEAYWTERLWREAIQLG